ncbi:hypothetical protein ACJJTC_007802 [Scirpophaga incertulas]
MFKKLKNKLAEEVKSSPQRIHQFAQAAQAAVTSASSSISDITNSDLFSIGENENQANRGNKSPSNSNPASAFQDVTFSQSPTFDPSETMDFFSSQDMETSRQRRLSNSSLASDVSFRLPSYESPLMYHLQSDMEVSASEAEERGLSSGAISLDRVTKEQLYTAYKRTQDRYKKYRTQYADLARHYKLLERENAKARSVLVETQDKALRRISELKEQCTLEQSAKAHLEKALRIEIEEKAMKIDALSTKVSLLQNNVQVADHDIAPNNNTNEQLITFSTENDSKSVLEEPPSNEPMLSSKIEKMEQLLNKYKESLKATKEKNSQLTSEVQILSSDLENKNKENDQLKVKLNVISEAKQKIDELTIINEELQNKVNTYDFNKSKEVSSLEIDLQKSQEEIVKLQNKIDVFNKREEEYAISLAENKLSIHKELESKELEIKSLKDSLELAKEELQSLGIVLDAYKKNATGLEAEHSKLINELNEVNLNKSKITDLELQIQTLTQKCQILDQNKTKCDEEYKCLNLQLNQETAEKLAMVDRNSYLEKRISQLTEDNTKKATQITSLENELMSKGKVGQESQKLLEEIELWKTKYSNLEREMQEERDELIKLQTEIEKLLANHELIQTQNSEMHNIMTIIKSENTLLQEKSNYVFSKTNVLLNEIKELQKDVKSVFEFSQSFQRQFCAELIPEIQSKINELNNTLLKDNSQIKFKCLESNHINLQSDFNDICEKYTKSTTEIGCLRKENTELREQISNQGSRSDDLKQEIETLNKTLTHSLEESQILKIEKQNNLVKIQELEGINECLQSTVDDDKSQYLTALDKLKLLEDEKQTLQKRLNNIEKENEVLNIDVEKLKTSHKDDVLRLNTSINDLQIKNTIIDEKESILKRMEDTITSLSQENCDLKYQIESITSNKKSLEIEIDQINKLHTNAVNDNDRLKSIIQVLEKKDVPISTDCKMVQTFVEEENYKSKEPESAKCVDICETNNKYNDASSKNLEPLTCKTANYEEEINSLKEANIILSKKLQDFSDSLVDRNSDIPSSDHELLKEENKRLKSDIEGLQTYLTKISKENGVLNDKLRELIASNSENSLAKSEHNIEDGDILEFRNEFNCRNEKIENLIRENTLLIEENLELKDQLQSQNFMGPNSIPYSKSNDTVSLEKYNNLLSTKNKIEERLINQEQMNNSINGNLQHLQNSNDKLKLMNEKLERRLDEALVSLRHLHSLQENTELEYLRNILYEYLTGSGTHSITLAKVLAAVVKFDDNQTHNVLQKEKERQGLLRQLGLI